MMFMLSAYEDLDTQVGKEELAARLIVGVKGDSLTAMDNPLSHIEISHLIEFYRNGQKEH